MATSSSSNTKPTTTATNKNVVVDMSTKVGGRIFYPALPVVDGSYPSEIEVSFNHTLEEYCQQNIPLETIAGIQRRERVLNRMGTICREWIKSVCIAKGLSADVIESAGGQLFTSGSYRLGVHEPGADIDTILVAPSFCRRQDFFGTIQVIGSSGEETTKRDPNSLAERIRAHADVTNFVPVEGAAVPLLTFDWEGVNIDLLFARLNTNSVPADFDIDNDAVLDGADSATEKSLNGPRVTNLIAAIVSGTTERYQTFLTVVRCVRKWAKTRGLYSNKMGYWGGVNINIGVALAIQLYPNACAATLLRKFFLIFKTWRWPQPLMLTKPHDAGYGLPVWSPTHGSAGGANKTSVAPMITPAYPAMNSSLSVSRQTLQILQEEFNRAHEIIDVIWKDHLKNPLSVEPSNWNQLFEPSDFFISYPRYLSLCIVGPTQADAQSWAGFVESRLRKLVSDLLSRSLPIKKIQLWPKKLEVCIADKGALLTAAQRQNCITYFIGFQIDKYRMRGEQLNVELPLQNFREWDLSRYQPLVPGMDVLAKAFKCTTLPKLCFDGKYPDGKIEAMRKRRQLHNADPVRQEKKRLERLEELKEKMAEMQRKKEEQQDKKRKREEAEETEATSAADVDEPVQKALKKEEEDLTDAATTALSLDVEIPPPGGVMIESEETDLLESALDTFQDTAVGEIKTREEAEADRQKLLAGELNQQENFELSDGKVVYESDDEENAVGYTGDGARQVYFKKISSTTDLDDAVIKGEYDEDGITTTTVVEHKDKLSLPIPKHVVEMLRKLNYHFVSDDEMKILGNNMLPPWRHVTNDGDKRKQQQRQQYPNRCNIQLLNKFNIVELDANGHVIDQGDDDYIPSKSYTGNKDGFEFKMSLRGLGYYRTGKEVVIPSNIAY